jgi:predicted 3-demethylubiquinone-9 3-methyltransferase (glyoxalase superfamily)
MYYYKNRLFTPCELLDELNIKAENVTTNEEALNWIKNNYGNTWQNIPKDQDDPVLMEAGELADFETDELKCDLNHPVDILP